MRGLTNPSWRPADCRPARSGGRRRALALAAARSGRPLVFGRGQNPINLVSVGDVAAPAERAVIDQDTRGAALEIGGPANLTFDQLAQAVQTACGRTKAPDTFHDRCCA
jgi:uncharacterized protein YbjT (DUF2867 family)